MTTSSKHTIWKYWLLSDTAVILKRVDGLRHWLQNRTSALRKPFSHKSSFDPRLWDASVQKSKKQPLLPNTMFLKHRIGTAAFHRICTEPSKPTFSKNTLNQIGLQFTSTSRHKDMDPHLSKTLLSFFLLKEVCLTAQKPSEYGWAFKRKHATRTKPRPRKAAKFRRAGKPANTFDHVRFSQKLTLPVLIKLKSAKAFQMRIAIGASDAL